MRHARDKQAKTAERDRERERERTKKTTHLGHSSARQLPWRWPSPAVGSPSDPVTDKSVKRSGLCLIGVKHVLYRCECLRSKVNNRPKPP